MARLLVALVLIAAACGSPKHKGDDMQETDALVDCNDEGAHRCLGSTYQTCTGGLWQAAVDCPQSCIDSLGCVQCSPGQSFCKDGNVWSCDDAGNPGAEIAACTGQTVCIGGSCADACADAAASKSYIACEYWAVDVDNAVEVQGLSGGVCGLGQTSETLPICYKAGGSPADRVAGLCDPPATMGGAAVCPATWTCQNLLVCATDAMHGPFGIVVSNPQAKAVNVTVAGPGGQTITQQIAAGAVVPILPQMGNAIPDQSVDGSVKELRAYKVTSDLPIVAYQFNPLDNSNVFSNDASLLVPRTAFDTDYYVMSWPTLNRRANQNDHSYYGYLTIVAWQNGTQISVTPTAATTASASVGPIAAGATQNFTLNAGEVVQLQAAGAGDLTGTHITSPNMMSFGVFGGHEAALFGETTPPDNQHIQRCCADHLEEMLFPSQTWGKEFAIARSKLRTNEPDVLRIMAQMPNTNVTFTPAPSAGTCPTMGPGQFCEVKTLDHMEISSDQPILVGHFIEAATWYSNNGKIGTGDPSMSIGVPVEQFRKEYTILVPMAYDENYISIAAAATGGVTVDGVPVTVAAFPGGGTHRGAIVPVGAGQHKITCADGCGIMVHGYSDDVSYMFAGGLDLKPIVIL